MKRSKKFLVFSFIIIAIMLVSLAACSKTTTTTTATTPSVTPTTTAAAPTTTAAKPSTTPTATTTQSPTPTAAPTVTPQTGGTLRIIWSTAPASGFGFAPKIFGGEGAYADEAMEPLMDGKFTGGGYVMRLATGWTVAPDGLSITFALRGGVTFHDGTDFNANAVKFNFDAMMAAGRMSSNFKSVEVIDLYHVKFNLGKWKNTAIGDIAGVVIASPAFVEKYGADYAAIHACGTGPFKEVSYEPDVKITLERFDNYWGQKAYLDTIVGTFIVDPVTQVMAMEAGQGDVTHSRVAKTMNDLKKAGFNVLQDYMGMVAANFDSANPKSPWANLEVRQAFDYAVNKKALVDTLGYGFWQAADQMPLPGQNGYLTNITPRTYDPDKAKALLADAGYANGFNTHIIHATGDFEDGCAAIQSDLKAVGINADIVTIDWAKWGATRQQGWDGIFVAGSGIISNYNSLLDLYFRPGSTEMFSILRPPGFQDLIETAVTANPEDNAKTQAAARVIFDQDLWSVIEHHGDNYAYTSKVHGLDFGTYGQWGAFDAEQVWMSK